MVIGMHNQPKIGVVVILKKQDKILLGKRLDKHGFGEWGLVGGHLELRESVEQCAIREVKEETNIKISNPIFLTSLNVTFSKNNNYLAIIFLAKTSKNPKNTEPDKLEEWKWFKWNELPTPLFLPVKQLEENKIFKQIFKSKLLH